MQPPENILSANQRAELVQRGVQVFPPIFENVGVTVGAVQYAPSPLRLFICFKSQWSRINWFLLYFIEDESDYLQPVILIYV